MDNLDFLLCASDTHGLDHDVLFYSCSKSDLEGDWMVALKTERRVFLWRVKPRCEPDEANKPVTLDELIDILDQEFQGHRARVYLSGSYKFLEDDDPDRDPKNQLYIADIKRDKKAGITTILVNRGDPEVVATAFLNTAKNAVRRPAAKQGESPGFSAHLVISHTQEKGHYSAHRAAFEQMPRVSSSVVLGLLNRITARAVAGNHKYTYTIPVKTKVKIGSRSRPYRPVLSVKRVPSERLIDDLEKGELSAITLTKRSSDYDGPGRDKVVRNQVRRITINTLPDIDSDTMAKFMRQLEGWGKEKKYESITFHLEKLPHGQTNNPTIDLTDDEEALEQLYVRAHIMSGFKNLLEGCYPQICDEIAEKMVNLVNHGKGW